jgi:mannose-6-phosphate isomerase-like protein (cupin superfamily)
VTPKPHVARLAEAPTVQTRDTTGHPRSGGRHWVLVDRAGAGAPEFSTGIFRLEPGEYHPLHHHEGVAELYYVTEGSGAITVGDEVVEAEAGTAIYLPPGCAHAVRPGDGGITLLWLYDQGELDAVPSTWLE